MSGESAQLDNRSLLRQGWDAVTGWFRGAKEQVTQTIDNVQEGAASLRQRTADTVDDARHPLYTVLKKGLSAVFGKHALKSVVDVIMNVFGDGKQDVHAFGSGTFMAEMQKWQRQLNRDLGTQPAASPAPA